ncbi:MAG: (2Fe-2S)-binding protein [Planctomycetota bacterium]|nr:MAG: (2Fe-2S)-binding protein [Planctomycetota bacterium]
MAEPEYFDVGPAAELPPGGMRRYVVDGVPIAVYHVAGRFYATDDTCTHAEASLSEGELDCERREVECPLHGARFSIETGEVRAMPASTPVRTYPVRIQDGRLLVGLR